MTKNIKTIVLVAIKVMLTFAAFYIIRKRITVNPLDNLSQNSFYYLLLALAFSISLIFLQAWRWMNIAKILSINIPYRKSVVAVWAGHSINNLLPTATAGDLVRSYTLKYDHNHKNKWTWIGAFFSEKYSAATTALLIAAISLTTSISDKLPTLLIALVIFLVTALVITPFGVTRLISLLKLNKIKLINYIYEINTQFSNSFQHKNGMRAFIISFLINIVMCLVFYIITTGLNVQITFAQCLFVVPMFTLLASLPISYAGWGIRELSCVALLQYFGVSIENAVLVSVLYGLVQLASCLPGIALIYSFFYTKNNA